MNILVYSFEKNPVVNIEYEKRRSIEKLDFFFLEIIALIYSLKNAVRLKQYQMQIVEIWES